MFLFYDFIQFNLQKYISFLLNIVYNGNEHFCTAKKLASRISEWDSVTLVAQYHSAEEQVYNIPIQIQ